VNRHIRNPMGKLAKVSAAVVVDGSYKGTGKTREYVSRTQEEMKNLENIVKKAIGYNEERKDQVEVINMPFYWSVVEEEMKEEKTNVWKDYLHMGYKPVVSVILILLFFFVVVRPLLKKRGFSPAVEAGNTLLQSGPQAAIPSQVAQDKKAQAAVNYKDQAMQIAVDDPSKTAKIVKTWLKEKE